MDERSAQTLDGLHPKFRPSAIQAWTEAQAAMPPNVEIIAVEGLRTFERSDYLYSLGRTIRGPIVTNAKGGQSYHNYGLAFDFTMVTNGVDDYVVGPHWRSVVEIMKAHGMEWGGNFPKPDDDHFENRYGYTWEELLAKYKAADFIEGTQYVNI